MEPRAAVRLARELLAEHGLQGWTVTLDRAKTRAGVCRFGPRQIGLSAPLTALHTEAEVRDTILHEIAHALVGPAHGHDAVWRATARRIGSSGQRCVSPEAARVRGDWLGVCPAGHEVTRHKRPTRVVSCLRCAPVFSARHVLRWTFRGAEVPMHPRYAAELAALNARTPSAPAHADRPARRSGIGGRVRITKPGPYLGVVGVVEALGSWRYQVRIDDTILNVPFELAEPA